jgi:Tol biopolymer transport system component
MRLLGSLIILAAAILIPAAACGGALDGNSAGSSTPSSTPGKTPTNVDDSPRPLARVPEGVLIVQRQASVPVPIFGIGVEGDTQKYKTGYLFSTSPDASEAVVVEQQGADHAGTALGVLIGDNYRRLSELPPIVGPWSPDGAKIAYALPSGDGGDMRHVYVASNDARDARRLTQEPSDYVPIGWSHDGRVVAQSSAGLFLIGESMVSLPRPGEQWAEVSISPDGRKAAIQPYVSGSYEFWLLDIDSLQVTKLDDPATAGVPNSDFYVSSEPPVRGQTEATPSLALKGMPPALWTQDSSRVAYYGFRQGDEGSMQMELRVADVSRGSVEVVSEVQSSRAAWSPDGRYLSYIPSEQETLALLGPDGPVETSITATDILSWTPSGRLVVSDGNRIAIVDPATLAAKDVTTAGGGAVAAISPHISISIAWSPSGRYMAFSAQDQFIGGGDKLYVIDVDTATATLLLDDHGGFMPVAWLR